MSNHKTVGAARETTIGNQCDFATQTFTHDEDGDEILIDAENNSLELIVEQSIIDERLSNWRQPKPNYTKGVK
jgi:hypothetical protein